MDIEKYFEYLPIIIMAVIFLLALCMPLLWIQDRREKTRQEAFEREVLDLKRRIGTVEGIITNL